MKKKKQRGEPLQTREALQTLFEEHTLKNKEGIQRKEALINPNLRKKKQVTRRSFINTHFSAMLDSLRGTKITNNAPH